MNSVNARLPVLLRWLKETSPDIACLQELKASQEKFPLEAINEAGYHAIWHGQKSWNGVAILSKNEAPIEITHTLPGDEEDLHSRYIEAKIKGIRIACLYLPNGNPAPGPKFDYKLKWMERLQLHARELLSFDEPVILTGDFNVIPTGQDVYKPERWVDDALFRPETRAVFHELLSQGWTDAIRKLYPTETIYTYFDYFRKAFERNAGLRIDHFLLSPRISNRLKSAGVNLETRAWEKTSDHAPVWIEIEE